MSDNEALIERYADEHFDRHSITQGRRDAVRLALTRLSEHMEGRPLTGVTPSDLMAWQGRELRRGLKPISGGNRESAVRSFLRWANMVGLISSEQFTQLKLVEPVRGSRAKSRPNPYSRAEVERFRDLLAERHPLAPTKGRGSLMLKRYLQGRSRFTKIVWHHARRLQLEAQVSLALEEGLRIGEVWSLSLVDLAPENLGVVVHTSKRAPGEVRTREVPYLPHSRRAVSEWLAFRQLLAPDHERPWLALKFATSWGDDILGPQGRAWLRDHGLEAFPGYRWHRFRHTFATERLRAGMPLEQVQVMMGHARIEQTLGYAQILSADVVTEASRTAPAFERNLGLT